MQRLGGRKACEVMARGVFLFSVFFFWGGVILTLPKACKVFFVFLVLLTLSYSIKELRR